jgi:tetratricopeptide (TPR) repeat protein
MRGRRLLCLICLVLVTGSGNATQRFVSTQSRDSTFVAEMKAGDAAFRSFENDAAWSHYFRAHAIDSTRYDAIWKLSRAYVQRGDVASRDEKKRLFAEATRLARQCVALYPDSAHAHFTLSLALGKMANISGGKRRIELSREVKSEADSALALDPHHFGAQHILGRWNYEIARLTWFEKSMAKIIYGGVPPGASMQNARSCFERAIALDPLTPINHLWLGETLIKLGDYDGARASLERCIELPDVLWDDRYGKDVARKRLKDIEGKK